jgi:hypothetical protein
MTTRVNIQNLSIPGPGNVHNIGVKRNGATIIVLKPGEERDMYVWETDAIILEEIPAVKDNCQ